MHRIRQPTRYWVVKLLQFLDIEKDEDTSVTPGLPEAQVSAEKQVEYICYFDLLSQLKFHGSKIGYQSLPDGSCSYVVHFRSLVFNIRTFKETKTMSFLTMGRHGLLHCGHERTAVLALTVFAVVMHIGDPNLRLGFGSLKLDGFHVDARGEFYFYEDLSIFCH